MGILLYIIATIFWIVLTPINWVIVSYKHGISNKYFFETAIDIDKFGNRNFRTLLNATLIKDSVFYWSSDRWGVIDCYKFGNVNETISSVLGKNQRNKTLTCIGKLIVFILDKIDKNHCKKSIIELE